MHTASELQYLIDCSIYYDYEAGFFRNKKSFRRVRAPVGKRAGWLAKDTGYSYIQLGGVTYAEHNLVWFYFWSLLPSLRSNGLEIDHINRMRADNRLENLRVGTHSQNVANTGISRKNTSGYRGVSYYKRFKKFVAKARVAGKTKSLGYYQTAEEAAAVVAAYRVSVFGDFVSAEQR